MDRLDLIIFALEAARRFPRTAGLLGGAVATVADAAARAPVLGQLVPPYLRFLPRALAGGSALALHEIDDARGEISLGGARDVMLGAGFFRAAHEVARERLGDAGAVPLLYELGRRTGMSEVQAMRRSGQWFPPAVDRLLGSGELLRAVRADPRADRLFQLVARRAGRLLVAGYGAGTLARVDLRKDPIEMEIEGSLEAKMQSPARASACHMYRGWIAGWAKELLGEPVSVDETACAAAGAARCAFLVRRASAVHGGAPTKASTLERTENG